MRLLAAELSQPQPGSATVLNHIIDILFVQLIRAWIATAPLTAGKSWLRGLADPITGRAIAALHADPGRSWTIGELAAYVGVSRATLARRFTSHVGETPASYLTRWRMDLAARRLRDTTDPISVIAASIGYTSEYAFGRAFSRARHTPPGRYRTQAASQRSRRHLRERVPRSSSARPSRGSHRADQPGRGGQGDHVGAVTHPGLPGLGSKRRRRRS